MKTERQIRTLVMIAIFVAVGGLSLGFAAFSRTLTIGGEGQVTSSRWNIQFANLGTVSTVGEAEETAAPQLNGTTAIQGYEVVLKVPGDSVSYEFDVQNTGTFDAEVASFTLGTITCVGTGANATTDAANLCPNISHTITYADGSAIQEGDLLANTTGSARLKLTLTYSAATTEANLPTDVVTITVGTTTLIYDQA